MTTNSHLGGTWIGSKYGMPYSGLDFRPFCPVNQSRAIYPGNEIKIMEARCVDFLITQYHPSHCYGPVLDRNGRHSTRLLTDTYRDTYPALV